MITWLRAFAMSVRQHGFRFWDQLFSIGWNRPNGRNYVLHVGAGWVSFKRGSWRACR